MLKAILKFISTLIPAVAIIIGYHYNEESLAFGIVIGWALFSAYSVYIYEKQIEELANSIKVTYEGRNNRKEGED